MQKELQQAIQDWLRLDQNETTRNSILQLQKDGNVKELADCMLTRVDFGTAGLRAKMGAGWSRMNELLVIQTSQGLCEYVLDKVQDAAARGVVIGYDHRHNSSDWARLAANVFAHKKMKVHFLDGLNHTPMVPFSVARLNAACGVMITASHNPKDDNGYKVYWENAVQIISPHDSGIRESIHRNLIPVVWSSGNSPLIVECASEMRELYFDSLRILSQSPSRVGSNNLRFVNTSLHGVGHFFVERAFEAFGFQPFIPVVAQGDPDPDFPTVAYPNPEEKGALNLAIETANECSADYILAQDPDADRFSAAERRYSILYMLDEVQKSSAGIFRNDGTYHVFTGDDIGVMLAAWLLRQYRVSQLPIDRVAMVSSTVSSRMLEAMAAAEGFRYSECLTGFKYIGNTACDLEKSGNFDVIFGYEEAIGFMLGKEIRDKDGVAATVVFTEMAVALNMEGVTALSFLQSLHQKYGYHKTKNGYFTCNDVVVKQATFRRIRNFTPGSEGSNRYPKTLAGLPVSVRDLTSGFEHDDRNPPTFKPLLPTSGGEMITFRSSERNATSFSLTLTLRTSGTEPKIKYYLEGSGSDPDSVDKLLVRAAEELSQDWIDAKNQQLSMSPPH